MLNFDTTGDEQNLHFPLWSETKELIWEYSIEFTSGMTTLFDKKAQSSLTDKPVKLWQFKQWQANLEIGAAQTITVDFPQLQEHTCFI